jgi:hypothetical protein
MKKRISYIFSLILLLASAHSLIAQTVRAELPRVFILNSKLLQERKAKIFDRQTADNSFKPAVAKLERDAQKLLKIEIASIVTKQATPPSGDKNDYMSQAPYFWRNPDTANGLPYIRRDGERNPEIKKYPDHDLLDQMVDAVDKLATAYYFTDKEEYAAKATEILRMWFLDSKTRMNPNLEYAQAIPGLNTGRGIGIIETRGLTKVVDSIGLLANSKSWTKDNQAGLEEWFSKYLNWLTQSKNGCDESAAKNNHGTVYDVQTASFALFVGKNELARNILEAAKEKRIARQIEPDGRQLLELERTKSWDYSVMNLEGLISLAELGNNIDADLWNFETKDGRGIRRAIEFLYPYASGEKSWAYKQIEPLKPEKLFSLMRRAARNYNDEKFVKMMQAIPVKGKDDTGALLSF